MWRLYGDYGRGVCLEFEVIGDSIKKVEYLNNYSGVPSFPLYFTFHNRIYSLKSNIKSSDIFYLKSDLYKNEKEWRFIAAEKSKSKRSKDFDRKWYLSSGTPFPSITVHETEFPLKLRKIYIGPNSKDVILTREMLRLKLETLHPEVEIVKVKDMGYLP